MRIRRNVLDAVAGHARLESPRECCGILVAAGDEIVEAVPAQNVAAEPWRRYEVSPAVHFAQIKRCRLTEREGETALHIAGVYHSHPRSAPVPSPTDLAQAFPEYLYVIAGPADGSLPIDIRAYRLAGDRFAEVQLTTTPSADTD